MENSSGDDFSVVFTPAGVLIRGFAHESEMSPYGTDDEQVWPGVIDEVPAALRPVLDEPAFRDEDTDVPRVTVCLWRETGDTAWRTGSAIAFPSGDDPDGSGFLFRLLADRSPEAAQAHFEDYYERPVPLAPSTTSSPGTPSPPRSPRPSTRPPPTRRTPHSSRCWSCPPNRTDPIRTVVNVSAGQPACVLIAQGGESTRIQQLITRAPGCPRYLSGDHQKGITLLRAYIARLTTALATAGALVLTAPTAAHATAIGSTPVRTFEYSVGGVTMKIPTGCMFTHIIRGGGRKITYQNAGVDCAFVGALSSGFCNWRIDFTYADTNNRTYRISRGRTHSECKIDPMRNNSPRTLPRYGKACAHLHVNGVRRVSQCHHITK